MVALAAAIGLVVGSFLNVCIHRLPIGESVVFPGSRCPSCGRGIRWWENVPVVSFLLLRGRCRGCRAPISWRYPLVEAATGALFAGLFLAYGLSFELLVAVPFGAMLLVLFFTDLDHQILPDLVTLPGFAFGLGLAWWNPFLGDPGWGRILAALFGAALGAGILFAIGWIWEKLRGVEAMGLGDVKLMAMVGAFTGTQGALFTLFAASVVGAVVGIALVPLRRRTLSDTLPFGCFLAPAAFVSLVLARRAIEAYVDFVLGRS